jgi:hypothetical protein
LQLPRSRQRAAIDDARDPISVDEELAVLKGDQELIRDVDRKAVLAARAVLAIARDGWFAVDICRARENEGSLGRVTGRMIGEDLDGDRGAASLLAGPTLNMELFALEADVVDLPDNVPTGRRQAGPRGGLTLRRERRRDINTAADEYRDQSRPCTHESVS